MSVNTTNLAREAKASVGPNGGSIPVAERLDGIIADHMSNVVERTELYRLVSDPATEPSLVAAVARHTMLESYSFTPVLCETTLRAIGKMPHDMADAMKQAFLHVYEELGHSELALRTFVALGGDENWARSRRMTPGSVAFYGAFDRLNREMCFSNCGSRP